MIELEPSERLGLLMARLNPKNVRFDVGSGGMPSLTPQDVAAALGMVPDGLGREALMLVHWPDGAVRSRQKLLSLMTAAQLREYTRRERAADAAMTRVATCDPDFQTREESRYQKADRDRWPSWVTKREPLKMSEVYGRIRLAVADELSKPRVCPQCGGRELRDRKGNPRTCDRCLGHGTVAHGPSWRAKRLGMKRAGYSQRWEQPYQWLFDTVRDELSESESRLIHALRPLPLTA